jgi:hypothetical protein
MEGVMDFDPKRICVSVLLCFCVGLPAQAQVPADRAKAAFESLKALAGTWADASTQGWTGQHTIEVIAGGSAILSTSRIGPHPGQDESMATLFHMDGDRLMLTHYCVAKNQPRLAATKISDDGKTIEFEFVDGTNMKSRDVGHMDRAIFTLESAGQYRSRWTFYQKGSERWMEEIVNTRRP